MDLYVSLTPYIYTLIGFVVSDIILDSVFCNILFGTAGLAVGICSKLSYSESEVVKIILTK
jgi:hypothetical protein